MTGAPPPVALVTGAAKGIGLAIVEGLARKGMTVWLTARDAADAEREAKRLAGQGLDVHATSLDVTEEASVTAAAKRVERASGRLDVLVNNAGVLLDENVETLRLDPDVFRKTLEANTIGPLRVAQAFAPLLAKSRHGRIVNVSSTAGSLSEMAASVTAFGGFHATAYSASKAALNSVTISLATELRPRGILVNAMCPGW